MLRRVATYGLVAAGLSAFLFIVAGFPLNHDVAWFMSVGRRMLDGEKLYRDLIDINPPLVVYLQLPAVVLSDLTGLPDVTALKALVVGLASVAIIWHVRLLGMIRDRGRASRLVLVLAFALLVVPADDFGQREHLLVLLTLPYLALKWRRSSNLPVRRLEALAVGIVAGLGIAIKPHFVLIWLAMESFQWLGRRKLEIRAESAALGCVLAAYVTFVTAVHPEYFSLIRALSGVYRDFLSDPVRLRLVLYFAIPTFVVCLAAASAQRGQDRRLSVAFVTFAVAAFAVAVIQGKGWRYHSLPVLVTTVVAWGILAESSVRVVASNSSSGERLRAAFIISILLIAAVPFASALVRTLEVADVRAGMLQDEARHVMQYQPASMLVLADRVPDAFPLSNLVGARSVSPFPSFWWIRVYHGSGTVPAVAEVEHRGERERWFAGRVVGDFTKDPPDLVLVDVSPHDRYGGQPFPYIAYLSQDSVFAAAWMQYERVGAVDRFAIWMRARRPVS